MKMFEPLPGAEISKTAAKMIEMARRDNETVQADFNAIRLVATPDTTVEDLLASYWTTIKEREEVYKASPEGQAAAIKRKEFQEKAAVAAAEGILPFQIQDQAEWDDILKTNLEHADGPGREYNLCTIRYAARWASLMEQKMKLGYTVTDIAEQASHEADVEGITGFMYGWAAGCLAQVWVHGEELRRWHNLKTQIHHEGERANETGGVLNPACLTIK